jgi:TonB family protein
LLLITQRLQASFRHLVCVLTVVTTLLLPLTLLSNTAPIPTPFTFVVSASDWPQMSAHNGLDLFLIWAIGAIGVLARFVLGVAYLAWKTRRAKGEGGIRVADVTSPLVWGWFRPTILMPDTAICWDRERWSLAIEHERAHVKRGDIWTSTLAVLAEALYWFHPLMWWLTARMREEQELACDEQVLAQGPDRVTYAELLMATAGEPGARQLGCRMTGGVMKRRVEHVLQFERLDNGSHRRLWFAAAAYALCLAVGAVLAPAATDEPYKIGGDVSAPKVIHKEEPKYTRDARKAKVSGIVQLSIVINTKGRAEDIHVTKSLRPDLDSQAMKAVGNWTFQPGEKAGHPVPVRANIEVQFRLI